MLIASNSHNRSQPLDDTTQLVKRQEGYGQSRNNPHCRFDVTGFKQYYFNNDKRYETERQTRADTVAQSNHDDDNESRKALFEISEVYFFDFPGHKQSDHD